MPLLLLEEERADANIGLVWQTSSKSRREASIRDERWIARASIALATLYELMTNAAPSHRIGNYRDGMAVLQFLQFCSLECSPSKKGGNF